MTRHSEQIWPCARTLPANSCSEMDEQTKLLAQAHATLVDEAAWLFICHDLNPRAMTKKVQKFHPAQSWSQDFTHITMG
jgi:peptide/nickel transport system substrate-binding protein